ncbi:MAG TPA: Ku protein [Polyangia bacterium]|jgi:DNA end-binding protein Ku
MAHAIWTGSVNFGLVMIPVKLFTAVRSNELHFHLLHKKDQGRINFVRRCSEDGQDVAWEEIERGFEYEKGQYVVVDDADFEKVHPEATQAIDIVQFAKLDEIDPIFFDKPYYLEPEKKGRHAYALLREALRQSGKVGIARVVIRTKEHLAAVKPDGEALVLELMHFADEVVERSSFDLPRDTAVPEPEMKTALMLIDTMSAKFDPAAFQDHSREEMLKIIEAKVQHQPLPQAEAKPRAATGVVDLMDVLRRSLEQTQGKQKPAPERKPAREAPAEGETPAEGRARRRQAAGHRPAGHRRKAG